MAKYLVTNADDFGFTRDVNSGIVEAHTQGILTATTLSELYGYGLRQIEDRGHRCFIPE